MTPLRIAGALVSDMKKITWFSSKDERSDGIVEELTLSSIVRKPTNTTYRMKSLISDAIL
jgi:hypothetical protein